MADATAPTSPSRTAQEVAAFLATARNQFAIVAESESQLRTDQLDDKRFIAGEQWPEYAKAERTCDKRPYLTVNRLPQFKRQITNQARQNRPSIQINPVDDAGDPDTAEVLQGMVRHIEARSHAQVAYDTAVENQVDIGRGWIRLIAEYEAPNSFNQALKIRRVPDPFKVYMDPNAIEAPFDAMYAFEVEDLDEDTFKRKFPDAKLSSASDFESIGDMQKYWTPKGTIRVADYFYVEFEKATFLLLSDGQVYDEEEAAQKILASQKEAQTQVGMAATALQAPNAPQVLTVLDTKQAQRRLVKIAKISGAEILEESEWCGDWIPLVPVVGDEIHLNGRVDYRGMTRDAKDQQRLYNYQVTALVETIADAPKAPWIIAEGQVEPYKKLWQQANMKKFAYLPYKPVTVGGLLVPPPVRNTFEPAIQAIVVAVQQADNDLKATTGFFDASLGERGPEQSGKAILARQKQGEIGSANYIDNLGRALWALGTLLINAIPRVYDAPRVLRIVGSDDSQRTVMVHAGQSDAVPQVLPPGVDAVYDLSTGRYDVTVGVGTSPGTRRQEAVEMMTQAVQANPNLMAVIGDLYFGSMDWPKAKAIAERLKRTLPPNLQDENADIPPQAQAMIAGLQQQAQELQAALAEAQLELQTRSLDQSTKKEIAAMQAQVDLITLLVQNASQRDLQTQKLQAADASQQRTLTAQAVADAQGRQFQADADERGRQFQAQSDAQARKHDVDQGERQRQFDADRENKSQQAHAADTILAAELQRVQGVQDAEEAKQVRAEQAAEADAQRQFEAKQQKQQAAQRQPPA